MAQPYKKVGEKERRKNLREDIMIVVINRL
jgi:hypothetical protein